MTHRGANLQIAAVRWAALLACVWLMAGCMHRRVTVISDPPGALLFVDGDEIGQTPVSFDYTYYGTREFKLVKDGYRTVTELRELRTPWYQVPPLDFVTDNFALTKINDYRTLQFRLEPVQIVPTGQLYDRARSLRSDAELNGRSPAAP